MEPATFVPATAFSLGALVRIFNRAFAGYAVPITQTEETLAAMVANNDVSLADSLVLLDGDESSPVGLNLLALRPPRGWIAGMGVDPVWRGQGHGAALMRAIIERARALSLATLHLEVLEHNEPARRLYLDAGFAEVRTLRVFNGPLARPERAEDGAADVRAVAVGDALAHFESWHPVAPSWQREPPSLAHLAPRLRAHELLQAGEPHAYALHAASSAGIALLDAGAVPGAGAVAALGKLLLAITDGMERAPLRAINVPQDDPLGAALIDLGCAVLTQQVEMMLPLTP